MGPMGEPSGAGKQPDPINPCNGWSHAFSIGITCMALASCFVALLLRS